MYRKILGETDTMNTLAVILEAPERIALRALEMKPVEASDVLVEIAYSGISTGTEKLLFTGRMPPFPGLGYPLVPGYESVGRIIDAGIEARGRIGDWVFVPGANCYTDARGLFGGTARRVIVPSARAIPIPEELGEAGVLCALAATALHAINGGGYDGNPANRCALPDLVIGHGVLGRLIARLAVALGAPAPTVWETNAARRDGALGYTVMHPEEDERRDAQAEREEAAHRDGVEHVGGYAGQAPQRHRVPDRTPVHAARAAELVEVPPALEVADHEGKVDDKPGGECAEEELAEVAHAARAQAQQQPGPEKDDGEELRRDRQAEHGRG